MATVTFIRNKKQSAGSLGGVKRYVEQDKKTLDPSGARLVSGQNCTPQFADKEFLATRLVYHKDSPVYFYHYTQSFSPEENITGQQAHDIAKEFAARVWPDSEVLIATHIDAAHIHSHFIVNAVCYESGKMLRQGPNTLKGLRQISDEICLAHGLSVLPPTPEQKSNGMSAREYRSADKSQSWKFALMSTIDLCMAYAGSRKEFAELMKSVGYEVKWTDERKYITYTTPEDKRCRDNKLHEPKYLRRTWNMNSQSDRPKSLEELKALNRPSQVEALTLLNGLLQRQQRIEDALKMMMTAEDAERILNQTDSLNSRIQALQKQVVKMSENNTTSTENVERASRKSVRSLTHTAKVSIILTAIVSSLSILLLTLLSRLL